MQCTSYIPVYYHARDLKNLGASGFSWHLFDSHTNYGEEKGYNVSLPLSDMNQCLGYDKTMLRQIIQNHEATFRFQVEELHRLYRRQRELMGEMRAQDLISQTSESCSSLSHLRSDISPTTSHARSWLLGYNIQQNPNFVAIKSQEHTTLPPVPFVRENSYNEVVKFLPSSSKGDGKRSDSKLHITQPTSDSGDLSGFNLNSRKRPCLIDLNEPVQSDPYVSVDGSSNGINSSVAFDLNCLPVSCFSEPESTTLDNLRTIDEETTAVLDCSSAYDQATSKGEHVEDNPVLHKTIIDDDKFLKTKTDIDLNNEVVTDEPSPFKSAGNADLVSPVSPENKEHSPPRGKSEDVLLSEQGEGQLSSLTPDIIAAQILITISSSAVQQHAEPLLMSSGNLLCWFAEIVSSTEDDLKKERVISSCSGMGPTSRRTRQRKDLRTEFVRSKNLHSIETAPLKRNGGKRARAKLVKHTKLCSSPENVVRKSMSSTSKRFSRRTELAVVKDWGTIRKRQEGYRRRASKFVVHSL